MYSWCCCWSVVCWCSCCVWCSSSCAGWRSLFPWFIAFDCSFFFSFSIFFPFIKINDLFSMCTSALLWHLQRRFFNNDTYHVSYILSNYGHAGSQGRPPQRSRLWMIWYMVFLTDKTCCVGSFWRNPGFPYRAFRRYPQMISSLVVDKDGSQIFRSPYAVTLCRGVH